MSFLPVTKEELNGIAPDFVLVTADAYVDHPSFGAAIIGRIVEAEGFTVGVIPQPVSDADYMTFGTPRIGFLVSGGVVDSMVNNYTVAKIRRSEDVYSEGGVFGKRPDRVINVYTQNIKRLFPASPVVIGGIEASLRRFAHYDYWADKVMPSVLVSSGADLLIYGMGERPLWDILALVKKGVPLGAVRDVNGTCYFSSYDNLSAKVKEQLKGGACFCPSFEEVSADKVKYCKAFNLQVSNNDAITAKMLLQKHGNGYLVQNPPQKPLTEAELDKVYALPYMRAYHPMYTSGVPAINEVKYSITSVRGCFGECSYCALTYHQGRRVQRRSKQSIINEAKGFLQDKDFKGYIHDVGGPTADFYDTACDKQIKCGVCRDKHCIGNTPCNALKVSHKEYLDVLRELRQLDGVKKVFVRSGVRFDYIMMDSDKTFLKELIKYHVSGQLKVAPEHCSNKVLKVMNKPDFEVYLAFKKAYDEENARQQKNQFLVPYFISSHPGCTLNDAVDLAVYLHSVHHSPEQVQDFYPTPSTRSTCMYYTGLNPDDLSPVYVPKSKEEKKMQRALLQYDKPENYQVVREALIKAGRTDLIGNGANCLIRDLPSKASRNYASEHARMPAHSVKKGGKQNNNLGKKPRKSK